MRIACLSLAFALASPAAWAADIANRTLIGFSPDGAVFAFMETGVQETSQAPYASLYVVDVATNDWAQPPLRVVLEGDAIEGGEGEAVAQAMTQARDFLLERQVTTPGRLLWSQPLTEAPDGDPEKHGAWPGAMAASFTDGRGDFTLLVEEMDLPDAACAEQGAERKGFALRVRVTDSNFEEEIYRHQISPTAPGCPVGWSLSDVLEGPVRADGGKSLVVLVNMFRHSFDGWDRRFVAVPFAPPADLAQ